jgi:dinuclear metal center YbgI/SA1388 family protein
VASRDSIITFLDELLDARDFSDHGPNGLQVPGSHEVGLVATGVSANRELIERAADAGAQLVIAHHGLFWDFHPRTISPAMKTRLELLFEADMSLAGYHLPLDAHPEVGNTALLCEELGLERAEPFGQYQGRAVGFVGRAPAGVPFVELVRRVERATGREPFVWETGPETVHSVGIVTGGAASIFSEAVALDLDAFVTGEPAEHVMAEAREGRVHFVAAGHYATETFGVRRLGELVAERFGVEHRFIDVPNPI